MYRIALSNYPFIILTISYTSINIVLLSERITPAADERNNEDFTDLDAILPSEETGTELAHQSPYFREDRKTGGGNKRKRQGGDRKLAKKGKWLTKKSSYSSNKSSGSSYKKSNTPKKGAQSKGTLPPPRPRTAKKE